MTDKRSAEDIYWEELLTVEDLSDAELKVRRQKLADIAQKAETTLYQLLDAAVAAGRVTEQQVANERAAFRKQMEADDVRLKAAQ